MLKTRALVLAKVESSYGTDSTPAAATDSVLCEAPEIEAISRKLTRANVRSYIGAFPAVNIGDGVKITFKTEVRGSGTPTTPPEVSPLFRACNFTETIGGSNVTYVPNSSDQATAESCTIYFWRHNIQHKATGCRWTWSLELKAGEYGKIKWEFHGIYAGPTDTAIGSGTYDTTIPARLLSAAFTIGGYAGIIASLKIDCKNSLAMEISANAATGVLGHFIKDRQMAGSIDPEAPTLASYNPWTAWINSTTAALSIVVGSAAGNKVTITAPAVQLEAPKYGERDGLLAYEIPIILVPNTGNDEISIVYA